MTDYDSEAFNAINWDAHWDGRYELVNGKPVEVPESPYAEGTFLDHYFDQDTDIEDLDEEVLTFMQMMENSPEEVLDILREKEGRLTVAALLGNRYQPINREELTWQTGRNPDDCYIRKLEEMGMLKVEEDEDETYQLKKESDAYWLLQIEGATRRLDTRGSVFDEKVDPDSETDLLDAVGSPATDMEEFFTTWELV